MKADAQSGPKILFVSDSAQGGAGIAAERLFLELRAAGRDVRYLVFHQPGTGSVEWNAPVDFPQKKGWSRKWAKVRLAVFHGLGSAGRWLRARRRDRFFRGRVDRFEITSVYLGSHHLENHPWFTWAEVIHLHWTAGFLAPNQKWMEKRWVISLHDANPFTAVCHFPGDCTQYSTGCRVCPQLEDTRNPTLSARIFERKLRGYGRDANITLHAPSRWIAGLAADSLMTSAYRSVVLPNVFPTEVFRPLNPTACRQLLGLPDNKRLGLFVAAAVGNVRKGFPWFARLAEAMGPQGWEFVIVGGGDLPPLPENCRPLGRLGDLRLMAAAYSAADVFISTTLQDTVPATVVEAQLCGTPVIGFQVAGQSEMVLPRETGYLDEQIGLDGLLRGIAWFESALPSRERTAAWASERWNMTKTVTDWVRFYEELP